MWILHKWCSSLQPQRVDPASQTWYTAVTMSGPRGNIENAQQLFGNIDFFNRITQENQYASHLLFFENRDAAAYGRGPTAPARWAIIEISNLTFLLEKESPCVTFFSLPKNRRLTLEMIKSIHLVYPDPQDDLKVQFVQVNNPGHSKTACLSN